MEASLWPYTSGAIVEYRAPFNKDVCYRYGILSSHLVLIINEAMACPSGRYQCFMLTSKVDGYFGYKVYVNTANPKFRGLGLVNTTEVYTIDHRQLGKIVGFVPRQFVEKCRHAYGYEIGLHREMPEYYKTDANAFGWLTAGEPSCPSSPKAFVVDGALQEYDIATAHHQLPGDEPRSVHAEVRPMVSHADLGTDVLMTDTPDAPESKHVDEFVEEIDHEDPADMPNDDVVPEEEEIAEEPKDEESDMISKIRAMRIAFSHRSKDTPMTAEFHEYLQSRENLPTEELTDTLRSVYNKLGNDVKYDIYMEKLHMADLLRKGIVKDPVSARRIVNFTINELTSSKNALIDGVIDKSVDLRFIMDTRILAYRILTLEDIHDIHMGIATYDSYLKSFGVNPADTYLGEMRRGELI